MKKFKTKKKYRFIKRLFLVFIFVFSIYFSFSFFVDKYKANIDMKKLAKYLINEGFNYQINNIELNDPLDITNKLQLINNDNELDMVKVLNDNNTNPIVYIYNTHDEENYSYISNDAYNINPNVKLAALIMEERLNDMGINTIVERQSIQFILKENNWIYKDSYRASRLLLEDIKNKYKSLKYYIDIHRDSTSYDNSTLIYDNEKYAKLLFVIGKNNSNYKYNLEMANKIDQNANELIPGISKGISIKEGPGVNGIYNQDFDNNLILIEIGGDKNNIIEVSNTINVLTNALYKYIKGDDYAKEKI